MDVQDIIIIGGGPAGLMAAVKASEFTQKILILEKMERPGRKLLITGKGRCNITNECGISDFLKCVHPDQKFLRNILNLFFVKDIIQFLNDQGVEVVVERGNRVFPKSEKASDVLNALLNFVNKKKIPIQIHSQVKNLSYQNNLFQLEVLHLGSVKTYQAKKVVICTGGKSYPATGSTGDGYAIAKKIGHSINEPFPSLVPLVTQGNVAQELQGVALKNCNAVLWVNNKKVDEEFGELLFTHFGLSGPVILTLSRAVVSALQKNEKVEISIDLKPALDHQTLDSRILRDLNENGKKQFDNITKLWMPQKMIAVFIEQCQIPADKLGHQVNAKERKNIMKYLKEWRFEISGHRGYQEAIITAGGVQTGGIHPATMESKIQPGLYFAGEVIDLDGKTGGYNLQIAWSTAYAAGKSAGENLYC